MTNNTTSSETRARLSFDLEDDEPNAPVLAQPKEAVVKKVQEISQKSGFTATVAPRAEPAPIIIPAAAMDAAASDIQKKVRRRAKTGRTYPFNTKLRESTYEDICLLADDASEKEGRPVSLAEIIERGTELLKKKQLKD